MQFKVSCFRVQSPGFHIFDYLSRMAGHRGSFRGRYCGTRMVLTYGDVNAKQGSLALNKRTFL